VSAKQERDEPDIRICVGFFRHHKTERLRRALGWEGVVALITLWCWARTNRHKGGLDGMSDEDIEIAADWTGAIGALVGALSKIRWMDGPEGNRSLHDWEEHQSYAFNADKRKAIARIGATALHKKTSARRMLAARSEHAEPLLPACPLPALSSRKEEGGSGLGAPPAAEVRTEPKPLTDAFFEMTPEQRVANLARITAEREAEKARRASRTGSPRR